MAAAAAPAAPPRVVPPEITKDRIPLLISEADAWWTLLKRTTAGYDTLLGSLNAATGNTPPGERKKGMPIFEYSATLVGKDSREPIKCAVDLKHVPKQYIPHVLVPILNTQAVQILESLNEIQARLDILKPLLEGMTGGHTGEVPDEQESAETPE